MAATITLDLTASFVDVASPTPFGVYDSTTSFQTDADSMVQFVNRKLGGSVLDVELVNKDVYGCFEQAGLEYSAMVNSYHAKSVLADILGSPTGSLDEHENKLPRFDLGLAKRRGAAYSAEALVGGTRTLYSGSITTQSGKQNYDLKTLLSASGHILAGERAEIREVFHFSPTAAYRFFDTTSAINYLHNEFSFESFTPETVFYLLPIWEDILRAQQLEVSHKVRRSNYSYNLVNNVLKIYPVPTGAIGLHMTYFKDSPTDSPFDNTDDPKAHGVSNLSNVPFGTIAYDKINSMGKQWIRQYGLSLSKEILGYVRSKVSSVPIPNGDLTLNGPQLISDAKQEMSLLKDELRFLLDSMTYDTLAQQERDQAEALQDQLAKIPTGIFMG